MAENAIRNGGAKAFGGLMAVGAIATFCFMLWQAQASNVDTLRLLTEQRLDLADARIDKMSTHIAAEAHPVAAKWNKQLHNEIEIIRGFMREDDIRRLADAGDMKQMREALRGIETQFRNVDRFLQLLWQRVYKEPLPNPPERNP
jgi:hypothetical protein